MSFGTLYILSAPSGAGKTSLVKEVTAKLTNLQVSVSHTTREIRAGEIDGKDYHFVSKEAFSEILDKNGFLEHAEVFGNCYGTSQASIDDLLAKNIDVILEIDWQGAEQIRVLHPESISVFILPPSKGALEERLKGRGQDSEEVIQKRMEKAVDEMNHFAEYNYLIVNDNFQVAIDELAAIFVAQRQKLEHQAQRYKGLITTLLLN